MKQPKQFDWRYEGKCHLECLGTNAGKTKKICLTETEVKCD